MRLWSRNKKQNQSTNELNKTSDTTSLCCKMLRGLLSAAWSCIEAVNKGLLQANEIRVSRGVGITVEPRGGRLSMHDCDVRILGFVRWSQKDS